MDNVTLGMKMRGVKNDTIHARAEKWLRRFGIESLAKRQARLLSGGEARRTSLAGPLLWNLKSCFWMSLLWLWIVLPASPF
jgi:tungstate transport system ATP-binding protein